MCGVYGGWCDAHKINLVSRDGLAEVQLVRRLNKLQTIITTPGFRALLYKLQPTHLVKDPDTQEMRVVRIVRTQMPQLTRWSSHIVLWEKLVAGYPLIAAAWPLYCAREKFTEHKTSLLPELARIKVLISLFKPLDLFLKKVG